MSVHCDKSVHFKIFEHKPYYISIEFEESFSLIEILRRRWFTIPSFTPERGMITDTFPSLSMCLEGYCQKSFIKWIPSRTNPGLLVIAWGSVIFLWTVGSADAVPICAFRVPECDLIDDNPIQSLTMSELASVADKLAIFSVTTTSTRPVKCCWDITIDLNTFSVYSAHNNVSTIPPSLDFTAPISATNSSINGIYSFIAKKTLKSVQITKNLISTNIPQLVSLLLHLGQTTTRPLIDITSAITELYIPKSDKLVPIEFESFILESILARIIHDEPMNPVKVDDPKLRLQLSFGLHHLHSRIDPIAASSVRSRQREKSAILNLLEEVVDLTGNVECCFCQSVMESENTVAICRICRIGITSGI